MFGARTVSISNNIGSFTLPDLKDGFRYDDYGIFLNIVTVSDGVYNKFISKMSKRSGSNIIDICVQTNTNASINNTDVYLAIFAIAIPNS